MPNLPNDWKWSLLEDVCEKVSVGYVGQTSSYFCDDGIPFLRSQNVRKGVLDLSNIKYVTDEFHQKSKKSKLLAGDILIVRVGQNRGDCAVVPEGLGEINCANIVFARPEQEYSSFLGYFFNSSKGRKSLLSVSTGSAQLVLNTKSVAKVYVPIPPKYIAKKIAHILSRLDDKIELSRKMNQTLEEMAQALFKSWFVDFDPVHARADAKSDETLEGTAAELGISKEILELFPSEFVESEMGMIPLGWEVKELHSLVKQLKPGTNYQPKRVESGIPFVNGKHIQDGFLSLKDIKYITEAEYARVHKSWKPEAYDVLITRIGTLGKVGVILESDLPLALHYNSIDIKVDIISHQFLYFLLKSDFFQKQFHLNKKQAVQEFITIDAVEKLKIILPTSIDDLHILGLYFNNIFNMIESNSVQIKSLQKTRDTLLPKLLSGELDVSNINMKTSKV